MVADVVPDGLERELSIHEALDTSVPQVVLVVEDGPLPKPLLVSQVLENLKLARAHFETARKALDRRLEGAPGDGQASALRREAILMIQTCVKGMGFFD